MRRLAIFSMLAVLYLSISSIWPIADAHGEEGAGADTAPNAVGQPKPSQRLKYRRGPVCMCSNGLSEKEIEAAERRRREERQRESPKTGGARDRRN